MLTLQTLSHRSLFSVALILGIATIPLIGCGTPATPAPFPMSDQAPAPTSAPAPTAAPAQPTAAAASSGDVIPGASNAAPIDRKIIKNAQLSLTVQNTPNAIFQITGIASDVGGYVVGSRTFGDGDRTGAQISIAVPVERFEEAVNMVRHVAQHIDDDTTSSAEVTEEYVDLQARLTNLDATPTRLRDFMNRAQTITETLAVNKELTRVEQEMEQIKGKLNALNARTAFSTIAVDLQEPAPTPSPTPSPTAIVWRPDETVQSAMRVQTNLFQTLVNLTIWFGVVLLPYLVVALVIGVSVRWFIQKTRKSTP